MTEITARETEKAVIVGLNAASMGARDRSDDETLDELEALLETAGGECVGRVIQNRHTPDPRTFIGDGKTQEVRELAENEGATLVVFDNELSPSQTRVLTEELGVRVVDRSTLILDIFADRASTREGRLQVELAQYKYLLPRLTGMWGHLVRQTGTSAPIGTRGPGETQLETDRRHIRRRIAKLEEELDEVIKVRATARRQRQRNEIPVVALVGYTNAGKSTLFNRLTGAGIHANDRLFDTLDTTTRRAAINESSDALFSDTVGFIRKLPHHLVDAFRATLEELRYADLILHVIDASNPQWQEQSRVTDELIAQLVTPETPRIEVFNKCDLNSADIRPHGENIVGISAITGSGIDELLYNIESLLGLRVHRVTLRVPYAKSGVVDELYRAGFVTEVAYLDDFAEISAALDTRALNKYKEYTI
ncbi:MAG: GTPase HflX [Oscillospiraceae bacterium]|jgi:GTP-binding protein HflX|nr:GTPase HflX [Oscillospiraceae bacterium]